MKRILPLFIFSILLLPTAAYAKWYWLSVPSEPMVGEFTEISAAEYLVSQISKDLLQVLPDSFMETLTLSSDSVQCSKKHGMEAIVSELRKFDADQDFYATTCAQSEIAGHQECSQVFNDAIALSRGNLIGILEKNALTCLEKEAAEKREEEIALAVRECNFDFFENEMTNSERIDTWEERQECAKSISESANADDVVAVSDPIVPTTIVDEVAFVPVVSEVAIEEKADADVEDEEVIETIQSEVEAVEDKFEDSLFKKIISFFKNLFSW